MLKNQHVCDRCCVTRTKMLCGCLFKFEFWLVHQHLIPYMWQLVFAYISIQGWVIDSDENGFFDSNSNVLILPLHNAEVVY